MRFTALPLQRRGERGFDSPDGWEDASASVGNLRSPKTFCPSSNAVSGEGHPRRSSGPSSHRTNSKAKPLRYSVSGMDGMMG